MFNHILFPTDGSELSFKAFPYALDLARTHGGRISILNVHGEFIDQEERQFLRVSNEQYQEMMERKAVASRERITSLLEKHGCELECNIVIREGKPKQRICEMVGELGADVVVIATRGQGGLERLVMGSTTEYVIHHCDVPVLVVHA